MKPIVFFSHSSRDKDTLSKLKDLFCEKTGGTIDVFLSCDGQSIPFGRNWVRRVEDALGSAKLMIIFITPSALHSNWIYFESGFAYAKTIRVVPVGFLGIDMSIISPPLSILQGFNITNEDGLDNLIAIANDEFSHKHTARFTADEYQQLIKGSSNVSVSPLGKFGFCVDEIGVRLAEKDGCSVDYQNAILVSKAVLEAHKATCTHNNGSLTTFGMSLSITPENSRPKTINFKLFPPILDVNFPLVTEILQTIAPTTGFAGCTISLYMPGVYFDYDPTKISGRLYGTGVQIGRESRFLYHDLSFSLSPYSSIRGATLRIVPEARVVTLSLLIDLLSLLFEREILWSASSQA